MRRAEGGEKRGNRIEEKRRKDDGRESKSQNGGAK